MMLEAKNMIVCPKQPYFVMSTEQYCKAVVMNYGISHFYCFRKEGIIENSIIAVPDGCIDILFCCDEKEPNAYVYGTVLHPTLLNNKNKHFFGVRFLPGATLKCKNVKMSDFVDKKIDFLKVIEDKDLFEQITSSKDFNYQIQVFMDKYIKIYEHSQMAYKNTNFKNFMLSRVIETAGQIKVKELADEAGYSSRYINRVFSEEIGLSPKVFSKLIRFQYLLSNLNNLDKGVFDTNLTQLSTELGYYDQSHMIKDFYELANTTPGKYIHSLRESEYKKRLVII